MVKRMMWCTMKSAVPRVMGIMATLPATATTSPPNTGLTPGQRVRSGAASGSGVQTLYPLGKDRLQLNGGVREHVLGTAPMPAWCRCGCTDQSCGKPQEDTYPVEVRDDGIAGSGSCDPARCPYSPRGRSHARRMKMAAVSPCTNHQEAANPHVVGKQRTAGWGNPSRCTDRGGMAYMWLRHDDGQRTEDGQVHRQLSMPGSWSGCGTDLRARDRPNSREIGPLWLSRISSVMLWLDARQLVRYQCDRQQWKRHSQRQVVVGVFRQPNRPPRSTRVQGHRFKR